MENKTKKRAYFYLILGVITIIVLAIGGTYAYFSASKNSTGTAISGSTNNTIESGLNLTTERLNLSPSPAPASDDLVPADFGVTPDNMTVALVNNALSSGCVDEGYTGCHVWKIIASSSQTLQIANIQLYLGLIDVTDKNQWSYVVYTGTDSTASTIVHKGQLITSFPNSVTTLDINDGGSITAGTPKVYYVMVYLNNTDSIQNDGVTEGTTDATGSYNGIVTLEAMGSQVKATFLDNAAQYITNLYLNNKNGTATNNEIEYNLALSKGLMNDRLGSSSVGADAGNIRYYGADPANYVWLGDNFTSDYTYDSNGSSITRTANSKKLWRIIGVFDGKLKLITADPISTQGLSWDTSIGGTNKINNGYGINQWGPSNSYEGADLMRLLNPGYEGESVNNSLYWTKGSGTVYTGDNNTTKANISFANTGLSQSEKDKIDTAVWYTGAYDQWSYVNNHYNDERGTAGKICSSGNYCNDTVERTSSWNGKVGLMYPSDYGYAVDLSLCQYVIGNYGATVCKNNDWLYNSSFYQWTMSPRADSSDATYVFYVSGYGGSLGGYNANNPSCVRPAVYLKPTVSIVSGSGTEADPYILI